MSDLATTLTVAETDYLAECEERIERGLSTFVEVGTALAMIRDNRLYRAEHPTFAGYCQERWGFTDRRARQIIEAAEIGTIVPVENEGQARELARVPEPERAEVYARAVERTNGKPTAAAVREVVKERNAPAEPEPSPPVRPDPRPAVAAALDEHVPDPDAPHREFRRAYLGYLSAAHKPMLPTVEQMLEHADERCVDELVFLAQNLTDYAARIRTAWLARYGSNVVPLKRSTS
jgi:hypothetical protein